MNQKLKISVVMCAHNPHQGRLERVMAALREQTLGKEEWELLLVDNASADPLSGRVDMSWHPRGRHILEEELGLTPARMRGIGESRGELVVWVDDDNVLDRDYLEVAWRVGERYPMLGVWGGNLIGEFEGGMPEWAGPYVGYLAVRGVERAMWDNRYDATTAPFGAGMVVRRAVAEEYAVRVKASPSRRQMDRRGNSLASCGDIDLAFTGVDMGYGSGVFPELGLRHLIPAGRLTESYLLRLVEEIWSSLTLLTLVRGLEKVPARGGLAVRIGGVLGGLKRRLLWDRRHRVFKEAEMKGRRRGVLVYEELRRAQAGKGA
jgi:glycosyltransferase involved in cell wall biosynthesis